MTTTVRGDRETTKTTPEQAIATRQELGESHEDRSPRAMTKAVVSPGGHIKFLTHELQWYRVERTEGRNPPPSLLGEEVRGISEENSEGYLRGCDEVKVVIQYQILRLIGAVHEKK